MARPPSAKPASKPSDVPADAPPAPAADAPASVAPVAAAPVETAPPAAVAPAKAPPKPVAAKPATPKPVVEAPKVAARAAPTPSVKAAPAKAAPKPPALKAPAAKAAAKAPAPKALAPKAPVPKSAPTKAAPAAPAPAPKAAAAKPSAVLERIATMVDETKLSAKLPPQFRELAERNVDQAKKAYEQYVSTTERMLNTLEDATRQAWSGARDVNLRMLGFADANAKAGFDYAERFVKAKDVKEIASLQQEYLKEATERLGQQMREIQQMASQATKDALKPVTPKN